MSSRSDFISKRRRRAIYARDGARCVWCATLCEPTQLTLDHVVPRAHGGTHSTRNLVTACLRCNSRRGCLTLLQFARVLRPFRVDETVMHVLRCAEKTILHRPTYLDSRKTRGQLTMVLEDGFLR